VVWRSDNVVVGHINEVAALRRAGLVRVSIWVTVRGYTVFVFNQVTQASLKMSDVKMTDMKLTDQFAGHEIAGRENDGPNDRTLNCRT